MARTSPDSHFACSPSSSFPLGCCSFFFQETLPFVKKKLWMLPCNARIQNTARINGRVCALGVCLLNGGIKPNNQLSYFSFSQDSASSLTLI